MKRQIFLDTETTGLKPEDGHRIVEIGAVEMIDGNKTGKHFYSLINPQRNVPEEAIRIHGITNEKLKESPTFNLIYRDFLNFIKGSEILIHNADFDIKFINSELSNVNAGKIWNYITNATCTMKLAKKLFKTPEDFYTKNESGLKIAPPTGKRMSYKLDSLCAYLGIDNSHRTYHGALLDSNLLCEVYIAIKKIHPLEDIESDLEQTNWVRPPIQRFHNLYLKPVTILDSEQTEHMQQLAKMKQITNVTPKLIEYTHGISKFIK